MADVPPAIHCEVSFLGLLNCRGGVALRNQGQTVGSLVAVLGVSFATFVVQGTAFLYLRRRYAAFYQPRSGQLPNVPRQSFWSLWRIAAEDQPLDAYFFLRFHRALLTIFVPTACLIAPLLATLHFSSSHSQSGIDRFSISNVRSRDAHRLWAHVLSATGFTLGTIYVAYHELDHYVQKRRLVRRRSLQEQREIATTVLISNVPARYRTEASLRALCDRFPGGVRHVWITPDFRPLWRACQRRMETVIELEKIYLQLIRLCSQSMRPTTRDEDKQTVQSVITSTHTMTPHRPPTASHSCPPLISADVYKSSQCRKDLAVAANRALPTVSKTTMASYPSHRPLVRQDPTQPIWCKYIRACDRPTARLPRQLSPWLPIKLPLGEKVDKFDYLLKELAQVEMKIHGECIAADKAPGASSAFVQFHRVEAALMCCHSVLSSNPHELTPRLILPASDDLLCENLSSGYYEHYLRRTAVFLVCALLVPLFAVPIAFTSLLSKLVWLSHRASWLAWLSHAPSWIVIALQGILPPVALGIVLTLVPVIFRTIVKCLRSQTKSAEQTRVQHWYFTFLFVQIFLVVTVSGGITESLADAALDPAGWMASLAANLPKAANYFLSYIVVQGLSRSIGTLLRYSSLATWLMDNWIPNGTPRAKWRRYRATRTVEWGCHYPPITNIAAIAMIYVIVSPIVTLFVVPTTCLFWIVYRHNILYVYDRASDGGGLCFPVAINHLFTGLYTMEMCLISFMLAVTFDGQLVCILQATVVALLLAATVVAQITLNNTYGRLMKHACVEEALECSDPHDPEQAQAGSSDEARLGGPDLANMDGEHTTKPMHRGCQLDDLSSLEMMHWCDADVVGSATHRINCPRSSQSLLSSIEIFRCLLPLHRPLVCIPRDELGISQDQVERINGASAPDSAGRPTLFTRMTDHGSTIDGSGKVSIEYGVGHHHLPAGMMHTA